MQQKLGDQENDNARLRRQLLDQGDLVNAVEREALAARRYLQESRDMFTAQQAYGERGSAL